MSALNYAPRSPLQKRYIELNSIQGVFIWKDVNCYLVYEGTRDYCGFHQETFRLKRDAIAYCKEYTKQTGLPRFKDFY